MVGTAAVEHPELVDELADAAPGRTSRSGSTRAAARSRCAAGSRASGHDLVGLARRFADAGRRARSIVTEIGRDGTLEGPDLASSRAVLAATDVPVVASGGVGTLDDLRALGGLTRRGAHG